MIVEWWRLTAEELRARAKQDTVVIVPVASIEQHGPHLPVMVDMRLVGEIARRAALLAAKAAPTLVTPVIWTGLAEHHMRFGGTFTVSFDTFRAVISDVCRSAARHGFKKLFILNGHGGNSAAIKTIAMELAVALDLPVAAATYFPASAEEMAGIMERQTGIRHACEGETSMMMALEPDLVKRDRLAEAHGPDSSGSGEAPYRFRSFAEVTRSGVIGDARVATREKGEKLLDAAAAGIAKIITTPATWTELTPAE